MLVLIMQGKASGCAKLLRFRPVFPLWPIAATMIRHATLSLHIRPIPIPAIVIAEVSTWSVFPPSPCPLNPLPYLCLRLTGGLSLNRLVNVLSETPTPQFVALPYMWFWAIPLIRGERVSCSQRMDMSRFSRLTNEFSKKFTVTAPA